jgi:putative DNA methylase
MAMTAKHKKKLIEVALPLDAINRASVRESFIYRGNPSAIHKWWAQRPLAAARAVIFAQMVDDPSGYPDLFPTEKKQEKERQRLFRVIEELVKWESTTDERVLQSARNEMWQSWRRACAENADHPFARELFDRKRLPPFHDPFAGGGTLPLEAQRLGLESYASDLNPVAVLINKALIEIPPKFSGLPPVNPEVQKEKPLIGREWKGAQGLAEDLRHYGQWIGEEAEKRIGQLYPKVEVTREMVKLRTDLKAYVGKKLTVIAWLWARTVKSPNPAFAQVDVPLASTFMLSAKTGKQVYIEPVIEGTSYSFIVRTGKPKDAAATNRGTKSGGSGSNFLCLMSGTPMPFEYLRLEAKAGRMGTRLMATVAEGDRGRVYLAPTREMEAIAQSAQPHDVLETNLPEKALGFRVQEYGMTEWRHLFSPRQLVALTTFSDLVQEAHERVQRDALVAGLPDDGKPLRDGGIGAMAYADGLTIYLAFSLSKTTDYNCALVPWYTKEDRPGHLFSKQAVPMVWDFAEVNPLSEIGGTFAVSNKIVADALAGCPENGIAGHVSQRDAVAPHSGLRSVVSTDPPYYDNIGYADLSDFFYVWLRRSLRSVFPDLFATLAVPKAEELVATPYRHGSKEKAEAFFLDGMTQAMHRLAEQAHPAFPVTIYYAFKQSGTSGNEGTTNTGWDTFLDAVIEAGFAISGTWPMRTERGARSVGIGTNALASSIVLVCRPRAADALPATRREFVTALKTELPAALAHLQRGNIAPVDLAQASIGPGMAVYTRYSKVVDTEGNALPVRGALALINQTLDEALAEQEGDFDADSRWALAWFEQSAFAEGDFGVADVLARAKVTAVDGMVQAGIIRSGRGKVRLLKPSELAAGWDPATDTRVTAWEIVHQLVRALESGGEAAAAALVAKLGSKAEIARELCYRLYTICERKKRAVEALSYNALVQSWPEINRLAREGGKPRAEQSGLFADAGE